MDAREKVYQEYRELSDKELDILVEDDVPKALLEKGIRMLAGSKKEEAKKYFLFASILGDTEAIIQRAMLLDKEGNIEVAYEQYMRAYEQGADQVLPRIIELVAINNKPLADEILVATALEGNIHCIKVIIENAKVTKNKQEYNFWKAKLNEFAPPPPPKPVAKKKPASTTSKATATKQTTASSTATAKASTSKGNATKSKSKSKGKAKSNIKVKSKAKTINKTIAKDNIKKEEKNPQPVSQVTVMDDIPITRAYEPTEKNVK